jgi:uncharacterized protein with GYD domain|tara:strand:- start:8280 stop:8840 length:561 start_codon:yes stop_codon:yes gene_type:complete
MKRDLSTLLYHLNPECSTSALALRFDWLAPLFRADLDQWLLQEAAVEILPLRAVGAFDNVIRQESDPRNSRDHWRRTMPAYLYQGSYSSDALRALVTNPEDRSVAARAVIEANGGTMTGCWMAFGEDDIIVIADMPDDESMAGAALAISSTGAIVGGRTTKLLTMDQAVASMGKAGAVMKAYKPPA